MVKCQNKLIEFVENKDGLYDCGEDEDVEARFSKLKISQELKISKPKAKTRKSAAWMKKLT